MYDIKDFKQISWDEVKPGDMIYIAGNLGNSGPTAVYGPHEVVNPKTRCLRNVTLRREFLERWECLYIKK